MSLKLSLDLNSNVDWSIHKSQSVANRVVLDRTSSHTLSGLLPPNANKANHACFFACASHPTSHTFSVACGEA